MTVRATAPTMTGAELRAAMIAAGLKQRALARLTGQNERTIRSYLSGRLDVPAWMRAVVKAEK